MGGGRSSHTAVAHRDKVCSTLHVHCMHCMCTAHHRDKVLIIGGKLATLKGRKELGTDRPALMLAFDMRERSWLPPPAVENCNSSNSPFLCCTRYLATPPYLATPSYTLRPRLPRCAPTRSRAASPQHARGTLLRS